ncbi:hypothetical protein EDB83DRAFT_2529286 [Lactarius deliciosus]|nr:hypothetical protein EDB83DRAFT_2529286 [Lactarius deliciosus]
MYALAPHQFSSVVCQTLSSASLARLLCCCFQFTTYLTTVYFVTVNHVRLPVGYLPGGNSYDVDTLRQQWVNARAESL